MCTLKWTETQRDWTKWTYSDIIDGHAHGSVVVDLLCWDRLGLIGQEDAKQQQ